MALVPIKNQPVRLESFPEETFMCATEDYCVHYLHETDDIVLQVRQTPCGSNLVDNGTFTSDDYSSTWAFTYGYWQYNDNGTEISGSATKIPGSAGTLTQDVLTEVPASIGNYYKLTYTISGMTDGTLTVLLGGNTSRVVTENGTYIDYTFLTVKTNQLLSFSADSTFDGNVSNVSCYKLKHSFATSAALNDLDGNYISSPSTVEFEDDRVIFNWLASTLDEGCYRISLVDECSNLFTGVTNYELSHDVDMNNPSGNWVYGGGGGGCTHSHTGGEYVQSTGATPASNTTRIGQNFNVPIGDGTYIFKIVLTTSAYDTNLGSSEISIWLSDGFYTTGSSNLISITNPQPNTTYTHYVIADKLNSDVGFLLFMNNTGTSTPGQLNEITSLSVTYGDVSSVTSIYGYQSNCLKVDADLGNMVLVTGQVAEDLTSVNEYSMGFLFTGEFNRLQMRLDLSFTNPHRPIKQNTYLYSSGTKDKTFAQLDKAWDLVFHAVDENAHDVISTMLQMEYTYINGHRYFCEDKEYSPNWAGGEASLAESVVEVTRADDTIFK